MSSDLNGSLRHTQLRIVGAPAIARPIIGDIRLLTGTLWHRWIAAQLEEKGLAVIKEVNVSRGLPRRWSGTSDLLWWSTADKKFVLFDIKTIKGEALPFIYTQGAKEDHLWQLSGYYYAAKNLGLPISDKFRIAYIPLNEPGLQFYPHRNLEIEYKPLILEKHPLPWDMISERLTERMEAVEDYERAFAERNSSVDTRNIRDQPFGSVDYCFSVLAPQIEPTQKIYKKGAKWDVKLVPHWQTKFCPYEMCGCSTQKPIKVGEYDESGTYKARTGYRDIIPTVSPKRS